MSDNITLTPEKTTTQNSRSYCPHLGLNSDRTIMFVGPTAAHRCYAQASPLVPDGEQQYHFCLSASHTQCPLYATPPSAQMLYMVPVKKTHRQEPFALPVLLPSRAALTRVESGLAQLSTLVPAAELTVSKWSFRLTKLTIFLTLALLFATIITKLLEVQPASALQVKGSEQPTLTANTPAIEAALLITIANPPTNAILMAPAISPGIEVVTVATPIIPLDTFTVTPAATLAELPTEILTQSFSALMPTPTSAQEGSAELLVLPKPQLPAGQVLTFSPKSGGP